MPPPDTTETVDASTVAKQILWLRERAGLLTTPLHVVKLVYLCHSWMLGLKGAPLINEAVVAGRYGPIIQSTYDQYKLFGSGPIYPVKASDQTAKLNPVQAQLIAVVHRAYEDRPDIELSELTHQPGTPWSTVTASGTLLGTEIPDETIRKHYEKLLSQMAASAAAAEHEEPDASR